MMGQFSPKAIVAFIVAAILILLVVAGRFVS